MTPPSLKPSGGKKHRKRRIGACDLLHPILYHLEKKTKKHTNTVQQLRSTWVFFLGGGFLNFYRYSKYQLIRVKVCTVFFLCISPITNSIQLHHFLLYTVLSMKFVADRQGGHCWGYENTGRILETLQPPQKNTMFSMSQFIHKAVCMYKYKGEMKMQNGDRKNCSADMVSTPTPKKKRNTAEVQFQTLN